MGGVVGAEVGDAVAAADAPGAQGPGQPGGAGVQCAVVGALQRELSTRLGYEPSAIAGLVDDLEKLGFAERRPSPDDRRSRIVVLTENGRRFLRDTDEAGLRVTNDLLAPLDAAERETLHTLLLRVADQPRRGIGRCSWLTGRGARPQPSPGVP